MFDLVKGKSEMVTYAATIMDEADPAYQMKITHLASSIHIVFGSEIEVFEMSPETARTVAEVFSRMADIAETWEKQNGT